MVDHEVELGLREDVDERWEGLHSVLTIPENNEVVTEQVAFLEDIVSFEELLDWLEDLLRILS